MRRVRLNSPYVFSSLGRLQRKFIYELIVRVSSMAFDPFDLCRALRRNRLQLPPEREVRTNRAERIECVRQISTVGSDVHRVICW